MYEYATTQVVTSNLPPFRHYISLLRFHYHSSFIGILLEHHAGRLPAWLAPVQAVVLNITDNQAEYALKVTETLKNQGLRVAADLRNEKVGFKIREHTLQRVPYLLVAGDREAGSNSLAVRTRNGKDLGAMSVDTIASKLAEEVASRGRTVLEV